MIYIEKAKTRLNCTLLHDDGDKKTPENIIIKLVFQNNIDWEVKQRQFSSFVDTKMDVSSYGQCVNVLMYAPERETK